MLLLVKLIKVFFHGIVIFVLHFHVVYRIHTKTDETTKYSVIPIIMPGYTVLKGYRFGAA
ncbi:MAG: hypothetical protein ACREAR_06315 [Nitrosotalea sp.]